MNSSLLFTQLKDWYKLSEEDCNIFISMFDVIEVRKNEHLFVKGEVAKYVYFVEKGCLRQYYVTDSNGDERTIYFKTEGGWASELVSFLDNKPTDLNLQALEPDAPPHLHDLVAGTTRHQLST